MANGKKGDHPQISADRYHHWKIPRFSPRADELISEIRDFSKSRIRSDRFVVKT
jgi:hypothetical protein